jgi:hypothetical protein
VPSPREDVKTRIDAIEESYEFFLAYAAQGLTSDQGSKSGGQLRTFLEKTESALDGLRSAFDSLVAEESLTPQDTFWRCPWSDALKVLERDASATLAAVQLVSSQEGISSQLIDNLNANIHFRALLTDLFLMDELIGA